MPPRSPPPARRSPAGAAGRGVPLANITRVMKRSLVLAALLTVLCLGLAVVSLSLSGCATIARIDNPRYSLVDVAPHVNLSIPPSLDFDLTVGVDNPNSVGLRLDEFDFDLFI